MTKGFVNSGPCLRLPASQNSAFGGLRPSRLIGGTINQLEEACSCEILFNLILFSFERFFHVMSLAYFVVSSFPSLLLKTRGFLGAQVLPSRKCRGNI